VQQRIHLGTCGRLGNPADPLHVGLIEVLRPRTANGTGAMNDRVGASEQGGQIGAIGKIAPDPLQLRIAVAPGSAQGTHLVARVLQRLDQMTRW
jgi:hypothetical protein